MSSKPTPKRILLLGAEGLLGSEVYSQMLMRTRMTESVYANAIIYIVSRGNRSRPTHSTITTGITSIRCDLSNPRSVDDIRSVIMQAESLEHTVESIINAMTFDMVINCAAMTDSVKCDEHPEKAYNVNCYSPLRIYEEARSVIHISTPAVYTGIDGNYDEDSPYVIWGDAPTNTMKGKRSVYRESKALIEQKILESPSLSEKTTILRGDVVGIHRCEHSRPNFIEGVLKRMIDDGIVSGYTDAFFTPIPAKVYAQIIVAISEDILRSVSGILRSIEPEHYSSHYVGYGVKNIGSAAALSKYEIVSSLASILSTRMNIQMPTVRALECPNGPSNYCMVVDRSSDLITRLMRNDPKFEQQMEDINFDPATPFGFWASFLQDMVDDYLANKEADANDTF